MCRGQNRRKKRCKLSREIKFCENKGNLYFWGNTKGMCNMHHWLRERWVPLDAPGWRINSLFRLSNKQKYPSSGSDSFEHAYMPCWWMIRRLCPFTCTYNYAYLSKVVRDVQNKASSWTTTLTHAHIWFWNRDTENMNMSPLLMIHLRARDHHWWLPLTEGTC